MRRPRVMTVVLLVAVALLDAGGGRVRAAALDVSRLDAEALDGAPERIEAGAFDAGAVALPDATVRGSGVFWLKVAVPAEAAAADGALPVLLVHAAPRVRVEVFSGGRPLPPATTLPGFRGIQDRVFVLPEHAGAAYVRIDSRAIESLGIEALGIESLRIESRGVSVSLDTLGAALARGAAHARMIALVVGGLGALSLGALLIWFVMADRMFLLYPTFFLLQALYIAFLSGEAFDWPILGHARALGSFAWNVPVSLSGAVGCLFAREIADLERFAPRIYRAFGWFAAAFVLVTVGNAAKLFGFGLIVNAVGNLVFFVVAVFTLVVAFMSWRRGNRAAGWYLIAWGLLEGFAITAAVRFLVTRSEHNDALLYEGLPLSMLAAAVLIALGVADRLRQQRAALSDAERRAQTDPLTGVLNRRSLIERLEAACHRARARGLPIAVLFIDLDHFKLINDTFGHHAGDACLQAIIAPIQTELRQSDVIGRYGGEEFVVILSSADAAAARPVAERICDRVAGVRVEGFGAPIGITCSIGVATSDALGVWGMPLINHADAAVYAAKRAGRNQVQMAVAGGVRAPAV